MPAASRRCCGGCASREIADGGQRYGGHAYRDAVDDGRERRRADGLSRAPGRSGEPMTASRCISSVRRCRSSQRRATRSTATRSPSSCDTARSRMLFTGDAGSESEERFLRRGRRPARRRAQGRTSRLGLRFVAGVHRAPSPRATRSSRSGRHNLFGHPAPSTMRDAAALRRARLSHRRKRRGHDRHRRLEHRALYDGFSPGRATAGAAVGARTFWYAGRATMGPSNQRSFH